MINKRTQKGMGSMVAMTWLLALAAVASLATMMSMSSGHSAILSGRIIRVQLAVDSALEWGSLQARHGICLPRATFPGTLPGFPDLTIEVTCASTTTEDGGSSVTAFHYEAIACTSSPCPATTPPQLYAERQGHADFWK